MSARVVPTEHEAEDAVIGALMIDQSQLLIGELRLVLNPLDFHRPMAQETYRRALDLHADGHDVDVVALASGQDEPTKQWLLEAMNNTPSIGRAPYYADLVIRASRARGWIGRLAEATGQLYDGLDIDEIIGELRVIDDPILAPRSVDLRDLAMDISEWHTVERAALDTRPWLVPHILRPLWRVIIVGGEGVGKMVLLRQIGLHAAAGLDPWDPVKSIDPVRVLCVDCENPAEAIIEHHDVANKRINLPQRAGEMYSMWRREGGIDLRKRVGRAEFEAVLRKTRPQLLIAGPLYKMFRRGKNDDMEQATIEVLEILDDFRTRYDMAMIIEHHAAKAAGGAYREMNPFGSSALLRWPEFGIALQDHGEAKKSGTQPLDVEVQRFRADRVRADWPISIRRNGIGQTIAWAPAYNFARGSAVGARWFDGEWVYESRD
jgi:replicative DNA helicase